MQIIIARSIVSITIMFRKRQIEPRLYRGGSI